MPDIVTLVYLNKIRFVVTNPSVILFSTQSIIISHAMLNCWRLTATSIWLLSFPQLLFGATFFTSAFSARTPAKDVLTLGLYTCIEYRDRSDATRDIIRP